MIKTKANLIKTVLIILLSLLMLTGGTIFLTREISTPPTQMEESGEDNRVYADNHKAEIHLSVYGGKKASVNVSGYYQVGNYSGNSMKGGPWSFSFGPNNSKNSLVTQNPVSYVGHYSGWIKVESASVAADGYVLNESTYASLHGLNNGNWNGRDYMTISALNGKWKVSDGVTKNGTRYFYINIFHTVRINLHHNDGTATKSTMRISTAPDSWSGNAPTDCSWVKPAAAFIPSRNGYSFKGYSTSATGTNLRTDSAGNWKSTKEIVASLSDYYAQWEANTIKLTLNKNGGSGGTDYVWYKYNTNKFYSDSACTNQITSITRPTRAGYTFKGYQGDGTCGGNPNESYIAYGSTEFASDLCYDIYKNATLNAVWEINDYNLKIDPVKGTYNNTTDLTSITQNYGTTYSYSTPTRTGYNFSGWHTGQNYLSAAKTFDGSSTYVAIGRSAMHTNGISVAIRASMNNWSEFKTSDMRLVSCTEGGGWNFEPNGEHIQFACYDSGVGYKTALSGIKWSELSSGYHTFVGTFDGEYAKVYIDGKLYGTSAKYSSGKIGYHASNGIFIGAEAGSNATTPVGNYFKGTIDYVAISNSGTASNPTSFTFPAHNSASTAQWTAKTFDLIYHGNGGGTPSPTSKKITYDNLYGTLATVSRTGYTFNGWWTAATGGSRITENTKVTVHQTKLSTLIGQ